MKPNMFQEYRRENPEPNKPLRSISADKLPENPQPSRPFPNIFQEYRRENPEPNRPVQNIFTEKLPEQPPRPSQSSTIFPKFELNLFSKHKGDSIRTCPTCFGKIFERSNCICIKKEEKQLTQEHLHTLVWLKDQLRRSKEQSAAMIVRIQELQGQLAKQQLRINGKFDRSSIDQPINKDNSERYRLFTEDYQSDWLKIHQWGRSFISLVQQATNNVAYKKRVIAETVINFEKQLTQLVKFQLKKLPDLMMKILTKAEEEKRIELRCLQDFQQETYKLIGTQEIKFQEESIQLSVERSELMVAPLRKDIFKCEESLRQLRVLKQRTSQFFSHQLPRPASIERQSKQTSTGENQQIIEKLE